MTENRIRKVLPVLVAAVAAILLLLASTDVASATLVGDKCNVNIGDDVYTYEVTKVKMYGEQGTVRFFAFTDGGAPTSEVAIHSRVLLAEGYYDVIAVAPYAFSGTNLAGDQYLESVTFPDSVRTIDAYAFANCKNLGTVNFGRGLKEICGYAFHNCGTTAETPGTLEFPASLEDIKQDAFSGSAFTGPLVLSDAVTHIGADAFAGCTGFTSLTIGSGLTSLSNGAFDGCSGLTGVQTIPATVTAINDWVFRGCTGITGVTWGNALTVIGEEAFSGCTSLASVNIPSTVTTFGKRAFQGCTSLTDLTFAEGLTKIGVLAFYGCTSLKSVIVPDSVTLIDTRAFDSCSNLETVRFGAGDPNLKTIGEGAFQLCEKLAAADIPDSVTKLGKYAFSKCYALSSLKLGSGITSIGNYAFYCCTSLTSLTLPTSLTSVGGQAFDGCTGLTGKTLTLPASLSHAYNQSFGNRYFAKIINNSNTEFDHYSFLKPDEESVYFYVDADGNKVEKLGKGTFILDRTDRISIEGAVVSGIAAKTYNGKAQTQKPTVKVGGTTLVNGVDYALSYKNNVNAGTATMTVTGKGNYTRTRSVTFKISKAANPLTVKGKTATVKYTAVRKKNQTLAVSKVLSVTKAQGAVTYAKSSGNGKITIDMKSGKITVKKGLKKGTYKVVAKVTAAGSKNYNKVTKSATFKVVVK